MDQDGYVIPLHAFGKAGIQSTMEYTPSHAREILKQTPATLRSLLGGLSEPWITGTEGPETWSPYDIVGHMLHGEETDWIARARIILAHGESRAFEPFDRFAFYEKSKGKTLGELLDAFEEARIANLGVLDQLALTPEQLELTGTHPELGRVTLSQLLATWVVHDLSHLAQIARVMAKQYDREVGPWKEYIPLLSVQSGARNVTTE